MTQLYLYDHAHDWKTSGVAGVHIDPVALNAKFTKTLANASHAIVHLEADDLDKLEAGAGLEEATCDQIILCVTTDPRENPGYDSAKRLHRWVTVANVPRSRCLFYARRVQDLHRQDVQQSFCALNIDEAHGILRESYEGAASLLERMLRSGTTTYLTSLIILIQGYLAAYALFREQEGKAILGSGPSVDEALVRMGFFDRTTGRRLPAAGDLWEQFAQTNRTWWRETLLGAHQRSPMLPSLQSLLRTEWATLVSRPGNWTPQESAAWDTVAGVIEYIEGPDIGEDCWLLPAAAAAAYNCIASAFETRRQPAGLAALQQQVMT